MSHQLDMDIGLNMARIRMALTIYVVLYAMDSLNLKVTQTHATQETNIVTAITAVQEWMVKMMRLIDADALVSALNNGKLKEQTGRVVPFNAGVAFALTMVEYAPTIDAVPVVRCRDCRWWDKEREQCGITPSSSPYGHCHDGETLEHSMIKDAGR